MNKALIWLLSNDKEKSMKVEILRITVKGFRNITEAEIKLDDLTAIVGLNGYGKSNVITAIDFGIDFIRLSPKKNKMADKAAIPLLRNFAGMDYSFEIEAKIGNYIIQYGFTFAWETSLSKSRIKDEHLFMKSATSHGRYSAYIIRRTELFGEYRSSEKGRCTNEIRVDKDELVLNKLVNYDDLFYHDILHGISEIHFYIEKHLDANPSYALRSIGNDSFDPFFNIPSTVWRLKQEHKELYSILIDSFQKLFPFVDSVECFQIPLTKGTDNIVHDNLYLLTIQDKRLTQPISFSGLSDGTKRVFLSLTFAVLAQIKELSAMVIEEPENSIHPSLLQVYLRILNDLSGDCKIIITSHSPYIIQYLPPENIYIGLCHESGQVDLRRIIKPALVNANAAKLNQSLGDYLFNCISFSNANEIMADFLEKPAPGIIQEEESEDDEWLNGSDDA